MEIDDYARNFAPHPLPHLVAKLFEFQRPLQSFFASGFEMGPDDKGAFATYSEDPAFLARLFPIAMAKGSGAMYGFWTQGNETLDAAPVVVFGDEGGIHVVAEDFRALLRILTLDAEPMIDWDGVTFYKADHAEASKHAADYAKWLDTELGLRPVKDAEEAEAIVGVAKKKHGDAFAKWVKQYHDSE